MKWWWCTNNKTQHMAHKCERLFVVLVFLCVCFSTMLLLFLLFFCNQRQNKENVRMVCSDVSSPHNVHKMRKRDRKKEWNSCLVWTRCMKEPKGKTEQCKSGNRMFTEGRRAWCPSCVEATTNTAVHLWRSFIIHHCATIHAVFFGQWTQNNKANPSKMIEAKQWRSGMFLCCSGVI